MDTIIPVYAEHAAKLVQMHGYTRAREMVIRDRDHSSQGTTTHAFHQAVLKQLESTHRVESLLL